MALLIFTANTFAMMWGKWFPKTGYAWPIDGGRVMKDGNRMLGDGKTWNGLIGALDGWIALHASGGACGINVR